MLCATRPLPRRRQHRPVSQELLIDSVPTDGTVIVGMIGVKSRGILAERGTFNPDWLRIIGGAYEMTFYDGANVVAWRRSRHTGYAAFAAIGPQRIEQGQHEILLVLMPMGLVAAGLLCFVMVRLARLRTSMPSLLRSALKSRKQPINRSWICRRAAGAEWKLCCAGAGPTARSSVPMFSYRSQRAIA